MAMNSSHGDGSSSSFDGFDSSSHNLHNSFDNRLATLADSFTNYSKGKDLDVEFANLAHFTIQQQ